MDQAVMSLAGVLCGIVASIPISIWLMLMLVRDRASHYGVEELSAPSQWEIVTDEPLQLDAGSRSIELYSDRNVQ